jgi:hypothetical protein
MFEIWSKSKKQITNLMCSELKGRIGIFATVYRKTHDQKGKIWIELDKKVIYEANTLEWLIEYETLADEIRIINNCTDFSDKEQAGGYYKAYKEAEEILNKEHKIPAFEFHEKLNAYLQAPFEESLQSSDDLVRILCLLDRRLGKRRLSKMVIEESDCDAVKILYNERCSLSKGQA